MTKQIDKNFTLGGSIENALTGNYELKTGAVLQEAWKYTIKHFVTFSPAILVLLAVQVFIFYVALKLQLGDPSIIFQMFENPVEINESIFSAIFIANFSYEVISAPIYAGVSLMAMSHAAGLTTRPIHILKGLSFTIPVIIATLASLVLQGIGGMLLPLLSMYFSIAFSNAVLLVCEKNMSPMRSLMLSFRAVNKKLFPLLGIYIVLATLMFMSALFYGFLLVFTLPFFFHAKGIIYRNMFGISLKIVSTDSDIDRHQDDQSDDNKNSDDTDEHNEENNADPDHKKGSDVFNA
jgi:hypothetical protein